MGERERLKDEEPRKRAEQRAWEGKSKGKDQSISKRSERERERERVLSHVTEQHVSVSTAA